MYAGFETFSKFLTRSDNYVNLTWYRECHFMRTCKRDTNRWLRSLSPSSWHFPTLIPLLMNVSRCRLYTGSFFLYIFRAATAIEATTCSVKFMLVQLNTIKFLTFMPSTSHHSTDRNQASTSTRSYATTAALFDGPRPLTNGRTSGCNLRTLQTIYTTIAGWSRTIPIIQLSNAKVAFFSIWKTLI